MAKRRPNGAGLSDRTVHLIHGSCRSALERAVEDGLININPADGTKLPKDIPKEMKILKSDEIERFLYQAKEEGYNGKTAVAALQAQNPQSGYGLYIRDKRAFV